MIRAVAAAACVVLLAACGADSGSDGGSDDSTPSAEKSKAPTTFAVFGTLSLSGAGNLGKGAGSPCHGDDGYDDIVGGAQVTIYDGSGKAIALGSLGDGTTLQQTPWNCTFTIAVRDVPIQKDSNIYAVEVTHRGQVKFTQDEATSIALTLG